MRLKLAFWLCLALSFGVARAQTPGTFAPNSQLGSSQLNAAFGAKANAANPVITGTLTLGGTGITGFGSAIGQALGPLTDMGGGIPGMRLGSRLFFRRDVTTATDFADFQVQRDTAFTSALSANVNTALTASINVGAADGTAEWAVLNQIKTSGNSGGQAVATYSQAWRNPGGSSDPFWAAVLESRDKTLTNSSGHGQQVGIEVGVTANRADDAPNFVTYGGIGVRKGVHIIMGQNTVEGTAAEFSTALWIATTGGTVTNTFIDSGIGFSIGTQMFSGLDTRGAIIPAGSSQPVAAVMMSAGHVIDFNGGTTLSSAPRNYLWYDTATSRWKYTIAGVDKFSVDASGNVRAAGTVTASVTP